MSATELDAEVPAAAVLLDVEVAWTVATDQVSEERLDHLAVGRVDRLYLGAEFCEQLLPTAAELEVALRTAADRGLAVTLVTPPCVEEGFLRTAELARLLPPGSEVVVNDWGVLAAVGDLGLVPVLGRTFSKNRRDPRIEKVWHRLPEDVRAQYSTMTVLAGPFLDRVQRLGVRRIDVDLPAWGADLSVLGDRELAISLHHGWSYVTTARRCPTFQASTGAIRSGGPCPRPCTDVRLRVSNAGIDKGMTLVGNTYFVPVGLPEPVPPEVDRLIIGGPGDPLTWRSDR